MVLCIFGVMQCINRLERNYPVLFLLLPAPFKEKNYPEECCGEDQHAECRNNGGYNDYCGVLI
jgi:hypothetical protein